MRVEIVTPAVGRLLEAELVEHAGPLMARRRLIHRPPEIRDRCVRGPARVGVPGGPAENRQALGIARSRQGEQVAGHPLALGAAVGHEGGGAHMEVLALQRRDLAIDRAPDHRVHEVQLALGGQHVDRDERFDRRARHPALESGEADDVVERHRRSEHRNRAGDVGRLIVQRTEPAADRPGHALGPEGQHSAGVGRGAGELFGGELGHQLAQQERVAARGRVAGGGEVVGRIRDPRTDHGAGRLGGEGSGPDDLCPGCGQRVEQVLIGTGLVGPGGAHHQHRELGHAVGHERQPSQRRGVGPVQIVGEQDDRLLGRQLRHQPVQTVQT